MVGCEDKMNETDSYTLGWMLIGGFALMELCVYFGCRMIDYLVEHDWI